MKQCNKCNENKNETEYYKHRGACKVCVSKDACLRAKKNRKHVNKQQRSRRIKLKSQVTNYLLTHPCESCGESNPIVLEFDHLDRDNKTAKVSDLVCQGRAWSVILTEIEKCRVLCANCHRLHTHEQLGWN